MKTKLLLAATLGFFVATSITAAPIRMPLADDSAPHEPPPIPLTQMPKDGNLAFGRWIVGNAQHENGLILIHKETRLAVYLPWASNGWINYRTGDGNSFVLWSRGGSDPQGREYDLDRILAKPPPGRIAPGKYTFQSWAVTVTDLEIEFHCSAMGCKMRIQRDIPAFTHNGRTIAAVK
ncbi:MAG: hypothetical protein HYR84_09895 [Planctomycetes bacterium]|nr:hypothetical protein [Planctomycetota bacterium]